MGTSRSAAEFVGKINKIGHATDTSRRSVVNDGALTAKKVMLAAAGAKGVTPGGKIAGRRWTVRYDIKGTETPVAVVRFTGPFHLVDRDTKAHLIRPRSFVGTRGSVSGRRGRGQRAVKGAALLQLFGVDARDGGAIAFNGIVRAYARHPGTSGKGIFPAAKVIAHHTVPTVMANAMKGAWRRAAS